MKREKDKIGTKFSLSLFLKSNQMVKAIQLLANSWSLAASGYKLVFIPRFKPWMDDVFTILRNELEDSNSNGWCSCCVPCCGPGHELPLLADILEPNWSILGVDVAPGMIHLAKELINTTTISNNNRVQAVIADCRNNLPSPTINKPYHDVILSIFGLQQMADPLSVLRIWLESLCPETGLLIVCFWPSSIEEKNQKNSDKYSRPFTMWSEIVKKKLNSDQQVSASLTPWDDIMVSKIKGIGGKLLMDQFVSHEIEWESFDEFWNGMTYSGPWRAMRLRRGDAFVDGLKDEYCESLNMTKDRLVHCARARVLVLCRGDNDLI
jgi:SAM-dependent methyltransferase